MFDRWFFDSPICSDNSSCVKPSAFRRCMMRIPISLLFISIQTTATQWYHVQTSEGTQCNKITLYSNYFMQIILKNLRYYYFLRFFVILLPFCNRPLRSHFFHGIIWIVGGENMKFIKKELHCGNKCWPHRSVKLYNHHKRKKHS